MPGIGPKTAALLLNDFQTLDELLDKAGTITQVQIIIIIINIIIMIKYNKNKNMKYEI